MSNSLLMSLLPMPRRVHALYSDELQKLRDISFHQLSEMFPSETLLKKSPLDLTRVKYYPDFMADPAAVNVETEAKRKTLQDSMTREEFWRIIRRSEHHELRKHRAFDFRLNQNEIERLQQNGLVVSERLQVDSFAEGYYRTYTDDLPVYITADSVLHAWHRSYDAILQEIEKTFLKPQLENIILALMEKIHELREPNGDSDLEFTICLDEIEFFLGVGVALLMQERDQTEAEKEPDLYWSRSQTEPTNKERKIPQVSPAVEIRIADALGCVKNEKMMYARMFGIEREVDFSLFRPRGHYTTSAALMNYFQAMIWFGTIDFRIVGQGSNELQLLCAIVFGQIVKQANVHEAWFEFDRLLTLLVGEPDSMTFRHLFRLLGDDTLSAYSSATVRNKPLIEVLKNQIVNSDVARQAICGHPLSGESKTSKPTELPLAFTFFGQRFLVDSYVLSKVVFDNVSFEGEKLFRRVPSGLDVAFTVFRNDSTLSEINKRIKSKADDKVQDHVEFRDGYEYSSNLVALRSTVDQLEPEYMSSSIVNRWLDVIGELSKPASHNSWSCHTSEWQKKQLTTQLASWTQLRHDNLLYVKQSFTCCTLCEYPAGFVDPYPDFWRKMKELAKAAASQLIKSSLVKSPNRLGRFFTQFAEIMSSLEGISKKQTTHEKLTDKETKMLKTVMEARYGSGGTRYLGWYPKLFYTEPEDSGKADYLVADVHTDTPDLVSGDPGCIVHVGVGKVLTAFVVVEHKDGESSMYAGPVYSYYEFTTPINQRLADEAWKGLVNENRTPSMPSWAMESYVVSNSSCEKKEIAQLLSKVMISRDPDVSNSNSELKAHSPLVGSSGQQRPGSFNGSIEVKETPSKSKCSIA